MEYVMSTAVILLLVIGCLMLAVFYRSSSVSRSLLKSLDAIDFKLARLEQFMQDEMRKNRQDSSSENRDFRSELTNQLTRLNESLLRRANEASTSQLAQLDSFARQLAQLTEINNAQLEKLRTSVDGKLDLIRHDNTAQLEAMRLTVDEKLHATLEKRLGESFKLVSVRLEQVHRSIGEMQSLAGNIGDLKRVLSNVKTRGIWGEIQLERLLEQILAPQQYEKNVATVPGSRDRVEFALKLPGRGKGDECVWLPIDAKFPQEDYQRLLDAQTAADVVKAEECGKALEIRLKSEARDIADKYLAVPHTTEFGILFLPTEGLYAEVLRRPGLCEMLMTKYKIIVTGPMTLAAVLNSLQMGFRTMAIEQHSSEVWNLLGAVKTEFGKFGDLLDKTHKKLQEASNSIDTAARKSRTIERHLKDVEEVSAENVKQIMQD